MNKEKIYRPLYDCSVNYTFEKRLFCNRQWRWWRQWGKIMTHTWRQKIHYWFPIIIELFMTFQRIDLVAFIMMLLLLHACQWAWFSDDDEFILLTSQWLLATRVLILYSREQPSSLLSFSLFSYPFQASISLLKILSKIKLIMFNYHQSIPC